MKRWLPFIFLLPLLALPSVVHSNDDAALKKLYDFSKVFSRVSQKVKPGVVYISSYRTSGSVYNQNGYYHPLYEFFGPNFYNRSVPRGQTYEQKMGEGSGFIVDAEKGLILTNNHVIKNADKIVVTFSNKKSLPAELLGSDPRSDVAVLKVTGEKLQALTVGDSNKIEVGDWVLAIGNPFGLSQTVTQGIISAKGRSGVGITEYENFIQTDAAINPGNSGGPLINLKGEVVGINTAILSRSGSSAGIGFALPINMAKSIMEQIINTGSVHKGWLGVAINNPDPADTRFSNLAVQGALIVNVTPSSPAERAGLKANDIVLEVDGTPIQDAAGLVREVSVQGPMKTIQLKVIRADGSKENLSLTLGHRPRQF